MNAAPAVPVTAGRYSKRRASIRFGQDLAVHVIRHALALQIKNRGGNIVQPGLGDRYPFSDSWTAGDEDAIGPMVSAPSAPCSRPIRSLDYNRFSGLPGV